MKIPSLAIFTLSLSLSYAQLGIGTNFPNSSAALELSSSHKGFLPPRIALTGRNDVLTISSPVIGLAVYNTATAGTSPNEVSPGYYYFDGLKWQRLMNQLLDATVSFNTLNPNSSGTLFSPVVPASGNYVYVSSMDGSQWTWNGTAYILYKPIVGTPWYLTNTASGLSMSSFDAYNDKISAIYRSGSIGIGTEITTNSSALLDVTSTDKGILPPRVTKAEMNLIPSPATGLIIYCMNCSGTNEGCLVQNTGTPTVPSWGCIGANPTINCSSNGFVGVYNRGTSVSSANYYTVSITNNSMDNITIPLYTSDLELVNAPSLSVLSVCNSNLTTITSINISAGQTQVVVYRLSGTLPLTSSLVGNWSKYPLSCSASVYMGNVIAFGYTGADQFFFLPVGVTFIDVEVNGASASGGGGRVTSRHFLSGGQNLVVVVGQQGIVSPADGGNAPATYGGGGASNGSSGWPTSQSGGGYSGIFLGSKTQSNALVIAGGGGGGNFQYMTECEQGGHGGGTFAQAGVNSSNSNYGSTGGQGGTQSAGGLSGSGVSYTATSGSALQGGNGGAPILALPTYYNAPSGGGGGGGYFGGGGGEAGDDNGSNSRRASGGGGGSSYTAPGATMVAHYQGLASGNGSVKITYY
jgi:hypothetical protein